MNTNYNIPETILKRLKENNETVVWSFHKQVSFRILGIIILLIPILFLIGFLSNLFPSLQERWGDFKIFAIGILILFIQSLIYFIRVKTRRYIATDQRILFYENDLPSPHLSFDYKDIFKIRKDQIITPSIHFETRTLTDNEGKFQEIPPFNKIKISESDFERITNAWLKKSRHNEVNTLFEKLAQKYNLSFQAFHPSGDHTLRINGEHQDLDIQLELDKIFDLKKMTIRISCPNPYHRFLAIKREKDKDKMKKIFGMQDLIIGNPALDKKYVLQSNDPEFLSFVLSEKIKKRMQFGGMLSGQLSFGEKKAHQIKDNKNSLDILDDQLIIEESKYLEKNDDKVGVLEYTFDEFKYHKFYSTRFIEQAINNFITVMDIALRIQEYGKS